MHDDEACRIYWHRRMVGDNERYVLDLCDEVLECEASRQHRFNWLVGDLSPKHERRAKLPFDAYWEDKNLIVEFYEKQHSESVPHFDKRIELTVSGVHSGIQRKIYDNRRKHFAKEQGIRLVIIHMSDFRSEERVDRET